MASGVLESVVLSFTAQLVELQQATLLRVDGETSRLCKEAISDLETRLLDLETHVRHMKGLLAKERSALPAARAIAQACALRQRQLEHIQAHLPSYLPGLAQPPAAAAHATAAAPAKPAAAPPRAPGRENQAPQQAAEPTPRYISHSELESLSSYMRARLTTDRVNAALDELHRHAQRNAALVLAARRGRVSNADKRHAMWLAYDVAVKEDLHDKPWALESDLRTGTALRTDKTGRAIITVLRHLGRITEARVNVGGSMLSAFLLNV